MSHETKYAFSILNVGQGSCQLVEEANTINIVIDCNLQGAPEYVARYLGRRKVEQIDLLILSGTDADHADADGLEFLKARYEIKRLWYPAFEKDEETDNWIKVRAMIAELEEGGTIVETPKAGHSFNIGSLNLKVLSPHDDDSTTSNNASIVVRVQADEVSAVFPGDCEILRWANILKYFEEHLPANVFLVAHHGSDHGCTEAVLKAVSPEYSVISAGEDNKYGHPDKAIMKLVRKYTRNEVFVTYEDGTILFESDGKAIVNVVRDAGHDDEGKKEKAKAMAAAVFSGARAFVNPRGGVSSTDRPGNIPIRPTVSHGGREPETAELEADIRSYPRRRLPRT